MARRINIKKIQIQFCLICAGLILASASAFSQKVTQRFDVRIPMRDGVELSADMWMPNGKSPAKPSIMTASVHPTSFYQ